jgi:hypothetical protein
MVVYGAGYLLRDGRDLVRHAKNVFHCGKYPVRLGKDLFRSTKKALDNGKKALDDGKDLFRIEEPALRYRRYLFPFRKDFWPSLIRAFVTEDIFWATKKMLSGMHKRLSLTQDIFSLAKRIFCVAEDIFSVAERIFCISEDIFSFPVSFSYIPEDIFSLTKRISCVPEKNLTVAHRMISISEKILLLSQKILVQTEARLTVAQFTAETPVNDRAARNRALLSQMVCFRSSIPLASLLIRENPNGSATTKPYLRFTNFVKCFCYWTSSPAIESP